MPHFTDQLIADYSFLAESYKSLYLGNCDISLAKKFYSLLKKKTLDLALFHQTFDDEIEKIGLMSIFADDGTLAHRGTYGPIKNYFDQSNSAIIALKKLWAAQFVDNLKPITSVGSATNTASKPIKSPKEWEAEILPLLDSQQYQHLKDVIKNKWSDSDFAALKIAYGHKGQNYSIDTSEIFVNLSKGYLAISDGIEALEEYKNIHWPSPTKFDTSTVTAQEIANVINKDLPQYISIAEEAVSLKKFLWAVEIKRVCYEYNGIFTYKIAGKKQTIEVKEAYGTHDPPEITLNQNIDFRDLVSAELVAAVYISNHGTGYISAKLSAFTDIELTQLGWEEGTPMPGKAAVVKNKIFKEILYSEAKKSKHTYYFVNNGFDFWGYYKEK